MSTIANPARYSIRLASNMSGVSAHTLRMWERRYGFPVPERTSGGARRYTEDDVNRLRLIARALDTGYRAGDVVGKSAAALTTLIAEQSAGVGWGEPADIESTLEAIVRDDVPAIRDSLRQAVAALGPKRFLVDFAQPLVVRVGELWADGQLAIRQEHVCSDLLTTQLRALMAGFESPGGAPSVLLCTLPNEQHGLPLEMVALYLALHQAAPRSLGTSLPVQEIAEAARSLDVDVVGLSVSAAAAPAAVRREVVALLGELPRKVELWVGGQGSASVEPLDDVRCVPRWDDLDRELARWRSGARHATHDIA